MALISLFHCTEWPSEVFHKSSEDETLRDLLKEFDNKRTPEVMATVFFENGEELRKALSSPLFDLVCYSSMLYRVKLRLGNSVLLS